MRRPLPLLAASLLVISSFVVAIAVLPQPASAATVDYAFQDGSSAAIPPGSPVLIDSLSTTLPDASNLVLAFAQVYNTAGADRIIQAGNLEIRRGTQASDPLIAQNQFQMDMQHTNSAPVGTFAYLLGRDAAPGASPTYGLFAGASATGINLEVKFLILNGVTDAAFVDGGSVVLSAGEVTIASLATSLPDQPTVVVAAIQIEQTGASDVDLLPGNLRLKRASTVLATNQFHFQNDGAGNDGDGAFVLLVGRDAAPGVNPTYSVTADASPDDQTQAEAKILAFSGLTSAAIDTAGVPIGTSRTVVGTLPTSFAAGEDVLIGAYQMDHGTASDEPWAADSIDLARASNLNRASNEFGMTIPSSSSPYANHYVGLLNAVTTGSSNPTYEGGAQVSGSFDLELKLVALHIKDAPVGSCDALTVVASDPSGQLWFNESVEPDGVPYTTQVNVSASGQSGATPGLRVTNDGGVACDITIRLLSDPGTGRSLKFNTSNNAPWPSDSSREVPLDPSRVTVCTGVAPAGVCDIWLWVDYENALGGQTVVDVRVETM